MKSMKSTKTGLALAIVGALALTGCSSNTTDAGASGTRGGTLNLGTIQDVTTWDPSQAHVGHGLITYQPFYDTLLRQQPDGTLVPMLATEWSYDEPRTTLTLDLRTDVTFIDGEVFDADAVVANMEYFKTANGRQAVQLDSFSSATAVDSDTVEVSLTEPDPAFEYYLSQAAGLMASPAAIEAGTLETTPVGTGPYEYDAGQSVRDSQITGVARDDYWDPELQKFDTIVFRILSELPARVNGVLSGQVDFTTLDAKSAVQAEDAGLSLIEDYQVDWTGLSLIDRDGAINPALADVRVRQAINYALDRETLLREIQLGYGTPTSQVFGPASGAFKEELEGYYDYNPDRARELLAEAGYADGVTIDLPVTPFFTTMVAAITQQLSDVGITVTQITAPASNYVPDIISGKYQAFPYNLSQGDAWVAINQLISTDATFNAFDSTSPELESLIADVRDSATDEEFEAASQAVNQYVTENAWFAPLYRVDQISAFDAEKITVEPQVQSPVPFIYNFAPVGS